MSVSHRFVDTNGIRIHVAEDGEGLTSSQWTSVSLPSDGEFAPGLPQDHPNQGDDAWFPSCDTRT